MANQTTSKCAHIACFCDVTNGQEYCGDACREAGRENVDIACQCDHWACSLNEEFLFHRQKPSHTRRTDPEAFASRIGVEALVDLASQMESSLWNS